MFEGFVLRQPRISGANNPTTNDPQTLVLTRDSDLDLTTDRDDYVATFITDDTAQGREFLIVPSGTANLIVGEDFIAETPVQIDDDALVYQFNQSGLAIEDFSLTAGDVPDKIDLIAGLLIYNTAPGTAPQVQYRAAALSLWYTRNDANITRFGFSDRLGRWRTLPGAPPELIGTIPEDALTPLALAVAEPDVAAPRIVIGNLDNAPTPVTYIPTEVQWQDYLDGVLSPNPGEAAAFAETGEILFAANIIAASVNLPVYQYRYSWFSLDTSTGLLGTIAEDDLYLNPVPQGDERPLIRTRYGSHLTVARSTDPVGNEEVRFDVDSGKLEFQNTDYDGLSLYYDGVYSVFEPVQAYGPTDLGTITPNFATTNGIADIDASIYDPDALLLYVKETGEVIPVVEFVDDPSDFPIPSRIPDTKAFAYYDSGTETVELQLSFSFMRANSGRTLSVGTGDFLIENGITFRMFRSLKPETEPDARARIRLQDEVVIDGISQGAFAILPQIPLQDIAGYSEDVFFRVQSGGSNRTLIPDETVVYDFDSNQIRWAERETTIQNITALASSVKLPNELLLDRNFQFELDEGNGYQTLIPGTDIVADFDQGLLAFSEAIGAEVYTGFGNLTGNSFVDTQAAFDFISDIGATPSALDASKRPLLVLPNTGEVYRIDDEAPTTLTLATAAASPLTNAEYRVFKGPDVVYEYAFQNLELTKRTVFPYVISDLDTSAATLFVPEGESFTFEGSTGVQPHVVLDLEELGLITSTLFIPAYYLDLTAQFELYRDSFLMTYVPGVPAASGEFTYDGGTGEITFFASDLLNFPDAVITLRPQLSVGRLTGSVEVLAEDRSLGLPADLVGAELTSIVLLRENQYQVQPSNGQLFFNAAFRAGDRLRVTYNTDFATSVTEDSVGFEARETLILSPGTTSVSFASGIELDLNRPGAFYINGSSDSEATVDLNAKLVTLSSPSVDNRTYQVGYFRATAGGGERTVRLLQLPFIPSVTFDVGTDQTFLGDHTSTLQPGTVLVVEDLSSEVVSSSYNAGSDTTAVVFNPGFSDFLSNPTTVQGTFSPVDRRTPVPAIMQDNAVGDQEAVLFGDFTDLIFVDRILYIDSEPYVIQGIAYDAESKVTRITTRSRFQREYDTPTLEVSEEIVYGPNPEILFTNIPLFAAEEINLIVLNSDGSGTLLERGVQYEVTDAGQIALDPTNVDLPQPGERWVLSYLAREAKGPFTSASGQLIIPRLRSQFTRFVAATNDTFAGGQLIARYSVYSPDTFYFRAVPLEDYSEEVSALLATRSSGGSSGPNVSFRNTQENFNKGTLTLLGEESEIKDQDRVGRRFITFYNTVAQDFEAYLQVLDGRVIGDRDGQFKFFIDDDNQPGGEDPVSGELLPYYANPDGTGSKPDPSQVEDIDVLAQEGFIRNSIDDLVLRSKKPFQFTFPGLFEFLGTFARAWEPSRISRFYPQRSKSVTITPPDLGGDGAYDFFEDFGTTLGDLQQEDVLDVESLAKRPPQGWLIDADVSFAAGEAIVNVGMVFELGDSEASNPGAGQNLTDGDASKMIPGFAVDDVVNLGRVVYTQNPTTGLVERTEEVYAQNMVVTAVGANSITLGKLDQNFFDVLFPDAGIVFGDLNITVTDPQTLDGTSAPSLGYDAASSVPSQNDTLFGTSLAPFRQGFDYGLDSSEGELINRALPDFLASITGQSAPEPLTYLEAVITYKNQRTEPFRFPALDGEPLDDDGLQNAPYGYPLLDSESVSFGAEEDALTRVINETTPGLVIDVTQLDGSTLTTTQDLTDPTLYPQPPRAYDLVLLEGETVGGTPATGGSTEFVFSDATSTEIKLAAFQAYDPAVTYEIEDAFPGTGTGAGTVWTDDAGRDFTVLSGLSGILDIGGSLFTIAAFGVGTITVVAGPLPASGAFNLDLSGTGSIDSLHALTDAGVDFTGWSAGLILDITSGINTETYPIAKGVGSEVEPVTVPATFVSGNAAIASTSIEAQGSGSANPGTPTLFDVVGLDFTPYGPASTLFVLNTNLNGYATDVDIHDGITFANEVLEVNPAIVNTGVTLEFYLAEDRILSIGDAAIDLGTDLRTLFVLTDLSNLDIEVGDTLIIPSASPNGGRYEVVSVDLNAVPYATIEVDLDFSATQGTIANADPNLDLFPVRFTTSRPRRFSERLSNLKDSQLQRRVLYDEVANAPTVPVDIQALLISGGYEARNPSTPSLSILTRLVDNSFDEALVNASDGEIIDLGGGDYALESLSSDFVADGVKDDNDDRSSFVLIPDGFARGFYRVGEILSPTRIQLREASEFSVDFIGSLAIGSGVEFTVYAGERFTERTYELVLYEFINVKEILDRLDKGIISTLHNTDDFLSADDLIRNPGDPEDATLQRHLTGSYSTLPVGVQDREAFLTGAPSLIDEVEGVLSGTENLYDLRFSWIDFRINLESGTLPNRRRLRNNRAKRLRERLRNLLRI